MTDKSLKNQAEEIMAAVDHDVQTAESDSTTGEAQINTLAGSIMEKVFGIIQDVDIEAAEKRVATLRQQHPRASNEELAQKLIREKCQRTGTVGAVTSGAGLIPGIGTAAAMTLGVAADIGATFKLQAELVLEIAAVYDYPLTDEEKQRIVLVITGLSAGTTTLTRRAGQSIAVKVGERLAATAAEKTFIKALPVVGVIASAGTNVLSTYIIGRRADAYFRLGPDAVGSWSDNLRTITGFDERRVGRWLAEGGKAAGGVVVSGAGTVAGTVAGGTKQAAGAAQNGAKAAVGGLGRLGWAIFSGIRWLLSFLWTVVTFVPRKIAGWFRRGKKTTPAE